MVPPGWTYEHSLTATLHLIPAGWVPEFVDFVRRDGGVDVYRDLRTGKLLYVGRTTPKS